MLFGTKAKEQQLKYTRDDVVAIIEHNASLLEQALGSIFYFTVSGKQIVTRDQALKEISSLLRNSDRTTIRELSSELDLSTDLVEDLIRETKSSEFVPWFYISSLERTVYGQRELESLKQGLIKTLRDGDHKGAIKVLDFCNLQNVDIQFLQWFVPQVRDDSGISMADDIIYDNNLYDKAVVEVIKALEQSADVLSLHTCALAGIEYSPDLVNLITRRILNGTIHVEGEVDNQGNYIPKALGDEKKKQIQSEFEQQGFISSVLFKKNKLSGQVISVGKWTLSNDYVQRTANEFNNMLNTRGWMDLRFDALAKSHETDLGRNLQDAKAVTQVIDEHVLDKVQKVIRPAKLQGKFIFTPEFDDKTRQATTEQWLNAVRERTLQAIKLDDVKQAAADRDMFTLREALLRHVKLPTDGTLAQQSTALQQVAEPLSLYLAEQYNKTLGGLLTKELEDTANKGLDVIRKESATKLQVYVNGIHGITDVATQAKLCEELALYAQQHLCILGGITTKSTLEHLQEICSKQGVTIQDLEQTKEQFMSSLRLQLEKASQPAQVLHLALLIEFGARVAVDPPGMLRATGKYVPKLLRQIKEGGQVDESQIEMYSQLKDSVMAKKGADTMTAQEARDLVARLKKHVGHM